jgi:hypothetical protein
MLPLSRLIAASYPLNSAVIGGRHRRRSDTCERAAELIGSLAFAALPSARSVSTTRRPTSCAVGTMS